MTTEILGQAGFTDKNVKSVLVFFGLIQSNDADYCKKVLRPDRGRIQAIGVYRFNDNAVF